MASYKELISNKVKAIFDEEQAKGNWEACQKRIAELVTVESNRSFSNGVRWQKKQAEASNDEVVVEEIEGV